MSIIRMEGIYKEYIQGQAKITALRNIDLVIDEGEFVTVKGPSGSGKSTLLYVAGLLTRPSRGRLSICGRDATSVTDNCAALLRRKNVGFIFQEFYLIPQITVLENVMLPLGYHGLTGDGSRKMAVRALERLGLSDRLEHYPSQLSGGERQRVAIARAVVTKPKIIFADEPTGNLDRNRGKKVLELLRRINSSGITILMVTHDQNAALFGNRIIEMADGEIVNG